MAGTVASGGRGGSGGAGGMGGAAGTGGAGAVAGRGGTGGSAPPIIIPDAGEDRTVSSPDLNCGARSKMGMKVAPDILILLDRSGSMNFRIDGSQCTDGGIGMMNADCGPESRWAKIVPAITQVVGMTQMEVNWGLKFFPDNSMNTCTVSNTAAVPIAPGNGTAVASAIMAATSPTGGAVAFNNTPTRGAAAGATAYMQTLTDMNPKYILLATDGQPTCGSGAMGEDAMPAVMAVDTARTAGFRTFVVGVATMGTGTADTTLSQMANAGGLPRAGTPTYYPVSSATELEAAIRTLIGVAASCIFQIGPTPTTDGSTSLDKIDVFGDGTQIMPDPTHTNGYDYTDATKQQIEVFGPLCDQIKNATIKDVTVTFQCIVIPT